MSVTYGAPAPMMYAAPGVQAFDNAAYNPHSAFTGLHDHHSAAYNAHHMQPTYAAPAAMYAAPSYDPTYGAPAATYAPMYAAPASTYAAPTYAAPVQTYAAPTYAAPAYAHPQAYAQPMVDPSAAYAQPAYAHTMVDPMAAYAQQPAYAQPMVDPMAAHAAQHVGLFGNHRGFGIYDHFHNHPAQPAAYAPHPGYAPQATGPQKTPKSLRARVKANLGGLCSKAKNQPCHEKPVTKVKGPGHQTHMLVACIDYKCCAPPWGPPAPGAPGGLDTKFAFDDMHQVAQACGVNLIQSLFNQQVTKQNLQTAIANVGQHAKPGDTFIFFYSGHGDHLPDQNGDEKEGQDEALCTLGPDGQAEPRAQVWTRDDDLTAFFTNSINPSVNIVVIADCCHSGTILDLDKPMWRNFNVVSLSGCSDTQTSAGTGQGGEFTRAICSALQSFQQQGMQSYGVDKLYNMILYQYQQHHTSSHVQDITLNHVGEMMEWPLVPRMQYQSPVPPAPGNPPAAQGQPPVQPQAMMTAPSMVAVPGGLAAEFNAQARPATKKNKKASKKKKSGCC